MSWETIRINKITCPCGKGTIEQEIKGDDWNRIEEETPVIMCDECAKKYIIKSKYFNPKPAHDYTKYYCVNKNNPEEQIELKI